MKSSWFVSAFVFLSLAVACSGADQSSLLTDSGQPDQSQPTPDASQPVDAGNDATVPPSDASQDSPTILDAIVVDVPIKPPDTQIACGNSSCSAQTQVCCYHVGATLQYECVASINDCQGDSDVPVTCSSADNCASEGHAGDICCALTNGPPNPNATCQNTTSAASVSCMATCDTPSFIVGCTAQSCPNQETCAVSKCSLPGFNICE